MKRNARQPIIILPFALILSLGPGSTNTCAQGLILSNSEANVVAKDLTDYQLLLKLYESRKGEIRTLESIRIKQDSIIANLNGIVALNEQALQEAFKTIADKQAESEKKDKKIRNKNRAIVGLTALQLLEIGIVIALIAI